MSSRDTKIKGTSLKSALGLLAKEYEKNPSYGRTHGALGSTSTRHNKRTRSSIRLLIKDSVFLHLFAMVFKELTRSRI